MSQPTYESVYRASVDDPERFWLDAADAVEVLVRHGLEAAQNQVHQR